MRVSLLTTTNCLFSHNRNRAMLLSRKFANTRSMKALRDSAAVHESQPTPATLINSRILQAIASTKFREKFSICDKNLFTSDTVVVDENDLPLLP